MVSGTQDRPAKTARLVIVGAGAFAEVACEYFSADTPYEVVGFAVERAHLRATAFMGKPLVAFEEVARHFPPATHDVYVAVVFTQLNRLRTRLLDAAKKLGYRPASYISPRAFVWRNVDMGEHCFIFENNVVQPFVTLGNNVVLWSGNHIGHHSRIRDNVFVSSHVVVSGGCDIGMNAFLGVNAAIGNDVVVAQDCWIGPGVVVTKSTKEGELYPRPDSAPAKVSAPRFFKVKE